MLPAENGADPTCGWREIEQAVAAADPWWKRRVNAKRLATLVRGDEPWTSPRSAPSWAHPDEGLGALNGADYLDRVVRRYGRQALYQTPSLSLGTIHASKGREATT